MDANGITRPTITQKTPKHHLFFPCEKNRCTHYYSWELIKAGPRGPIKTVQLLYAAFILYPDVNDYTLYYHSEPRMGKFSLWPLVQSLKQAASHKTVVYFPYLSLKATRTNAQQQSSSLPSDVWLLIMMLLWWFRWFIGGRLFLRLVFIVNAHILRNKCLYYCHFGAAVGRVQRSNADINRTRCL